MKAILMLLGFLGIGISSYAWPVIDEAVQTGSAAVKVYRDSVNPSMYWYIPVSIEPWKKSDKFKSQLVHVPGKSMTFIFRGQASVDEETLSSVAKMLGVSSANLTPIAYDTSSNLICENVYDSNQLKWVFPSRIGNYLEVVPMTIRTTDLDLMDELTQIINGGGLACTVDVTFKAVSTGYSLSIQADLDEVFSRFQSNAHAQGLWWEVDIQQVVQSLITSGIIKVSKIEDAEYVATPLDAQLNKAFSDIVENITRAIFTRSVKIPDGHMANRGRAFSLRADYFRSAEHKKYNASLNAKRVQSKESQIGLRIAVE